MSKKSEKYTKKSNNSKSKRVKITNLNMWTYNDDCKLEMVKIPIEHRMGFLNNFGFLDIPSKQKVMEWLENINI
jgi:hypothetical protein